MTLRTLVKLIGAFALVNTPAWATDSPLPPDVAARDMGGGRLFVSADGLTLYTYKRDREQMGTSTCVDECAELWPPVIVSADAEPVGAWTFVTRPDGTSQWAYHGEPVYTYAKDVFPGAMVGEKASGSWDVLYEPIDTPPNVAIRPSVLGQTLSDLNGRTIYTGPASDCDESCMAPWLPVEAPWLARPNSEDWTINRRFDGLSQWVYKDQPLYITNGDCGENERNCDDADGDWSAVILQDAPAIPEWVTVQETDIGPVMATPDRMTLYHLVSNWETVRVTTCDEACVDANWDPMIVPEDGKPVGNWTTRSMPDGRLQWMYLGRPVFTFKGDRMPGDTYGDKFGTGSDIRGGWGAILEESLIQVLVR